jgi:hypothetical protein
MAFNPNFVKGATLQQIREAMNYAAYLITPEQEKALKAEKAIEPVVETDWKQIVDKVDEVPDVSNQVVYPAGPVGVPYEHPPAQRITGTNLYHNN